MEGEYNPNPEQLASRKEESVNNLDKRVKQGGRVSLVDVQQLIRADKGDISGELATADKNDTTTIKSLKRRQTHLGQLENYILDTIVPLEKTPDRKEQGSRYQAIKEYLQEFADKEPDLFTQLQDRVDLAFESSSPDVETTAEVIADQQEHPHDATWNEATQIIEAAKRQMIDNEQAPATLDPLTETVQKIQSGRPISVQERKQLIIFLDEQRNKITDNAGKDMLLVLATETDDYQRPDIFSLPPEYIPTDTRFLAQETDAIIKQLQERQTEEETEPPTFAQLATIIDAEQTDSTTNESNFMRLRPLFAEQKAAALRAFTLFVNEDSNDEVDISVFMQEDGTFAAQQGIAPKASGYYTYKGDKSWLNQHIQTTTPFEIHRRGLAILTERCTDIDTQLAQNKPLTQAQRLDGKRGLMTYLDRHIARLKGQREQAIMITYKEKLTGLMT